jgi:hypothetical protein
VKAKVSLTIDDALLDFLDGQPGATRSEKVETALRRYRDAWTDMRLREELATYNAKDDDAETAAWRVVMQEAMWSQSAAATSGRSASRRSRNRARR